MTEQEWLECTDPQPMLEFLREKASDRKLRLFAVLCEREYLRFRPDLNVGIVPKWADVTERYADGVATIEEWDVVRRCVHGMFHATDPHQQALQGVETAASAAGWNQTRSFDNQQALDEGRRLTDFLHCIFGNHFHPVIIDPAWLAWHDATIPSIAKTIYDERRFTDLSILADALEEAGCTNADILNHCRSNGPHVRGCWVVDLILGKQ